MLLRLFTTRILPFMVVLALLLGFGAVIGVNSSATVSTAEACNPCECENDRRLNCQGVEFYAVYTRSFDDPNITCSLEAWRIGADGAGRLVLRVNNLTLERFPATDRNTLIRQNDGVALYRLSSGELQINAGPDAIGKIYTLRFDGGGCSGGGVTEGSYISGQ
ncbi:hypothetical protein FBR02_00630 [Anaerolineae bacterium CFX9]|jgi:hypothetical protein|nr:hypothetical protein [Anaerolineae bacterium CFX9]